MYTSASIKPPPEGSGKLLFGGGAHHPFLGNHKALLGPVVASQPLLHLPEQKEVCWHEVRQIGRVLQYLNHL